MRLIVTFLLALPMIASSQTLTYGWPSLGMGPCTEWIGCDNGCSGCNSPLGGNAVLFGAAAAWFDVEACPHVKPGGDNNLLTTGWGAQPNEAMIVFSLFAMHPLQVDSIIITHHGAADGSERLRVRYGTNAVLPETVIHDGVIAADEQRTVITGLDCIAAQEGAAFGTAQLILQAYEGGDDWWLDEVRIVTSDCTAMNVQQLESTAPLRARPVLDLLGRPIARNAAQGIYIDAQGRRVMVVE